MAKERIDVLLVKRNLVETREKAKRLVMAGLVFTNTERLDKPGVKVDEDIPLTVKGTIKYVSRGGFKLEKALEQFNITVKDKIMVDIGASTGGFTDCALQNGVKLVYAIDVGYNQLDWKIRSNEQVIVKERTNFRYVTRELFDHGIPSFSSIDVSFISLKIILPVLKDILAENSDIVALIKPQFEARREDVGKKGVIRDKEIHLSVLKNTLEFALKEGYDLLNLTYSPITGGEGNIEFLAHLGWKTDLLSANIDEIVQDTVERAHTNLT